MFSKFLIAAPASGSGKTMIARGLMRALAQRGLRVQPYKCGPDYIDTKFHALAAHRPSVNLDCFMASAPHLKALYAHYAQTADACVVEGMMGLFDGYDRDRGSAAEIAELLQLPVVLVVNAQSAAYSTAALISGFLHFRPSLRFAGVLFNKVGSARHFQMLQEACADLNVPCLGYLPKDKQLEQSSRYLGLDFSQEEAAETLDYLAHQLEAHVDIDRLLRLTEAKRPQDQDPFPAIKPLGWRIAVARNAESFTFIYSQHLDLLRRMGEVRFFDPEADDPLPPNSDLLYLPGGYPEQRAEQLSKASRTIASIQSYIAQGGRALAECGGMIYLTKGILQAAEPRRIPMAGVIPCYITTEAAKRKLSLGYRQFAYNGLTLRGHEFHYTQFAEDAPLPASLAQVRNAKGEPTATPVFRLRNLIASYTHLYWGELDIVQLFHIEKKA